MRRESSGMRTGYSYETHLAGFSQKLDFTREGTDEFRRSSGD